MDWITKILGNEWARTVMLVVLNAVVFFFMPRKKKAASAEPPEPTPLPKDGDSISWGITEDLPVLADLGRAVDPYRCPNDSFGCPIVRMDDGTIVELQVQADGPALRIVVVWLGVLEQLPVSDVKATLVYLHQQPHRFQTFTLHSCGRGFFAQLKNDFSIGVVTVTAQVGGRFRVAARILQSADWYVPPPPEPPASEPAAA